MTGMQVHSRRSRRWPAWAAGVGGLLAWLAAATAQALELRELRYAALPGDRVQITLELDGPAPEPRSFTVDNPARIALDLPGVANRLTRRSRTVGVGAVRAVTAAEARGRTRVVVSLVRMVPFETRVEGNRVLLTVEPPGAAAAEAAQPAAVRVAATRPAAAAGRAITDVDFRRGPHGEGRVIVKLSQPGTPVDVRQEGGRIVADFLDTSLPERLARRLDVVDFATPVTLVDTYAKDSGVRMTVTATGDYDYVAYQSDSVFTLEVKPVPKAEQERRRKEKLGYTGERLSLNFQDIEVRAVLQLIADFTGLNVVVSDTVKGNITLRLKNVPWDQALDIILKTKGLAMRKMGNVILIAPSEEIAAREKLELEAKKQIEELAPLRAEFIQINYAKASDIAALLKKKENSILSPRGSVTVDERTNILLVQDTADKLEEIRRLVAKLDVPVRQVLIESRIVIANDDFVRDLGVRFGWSKNQTYKSVHQVWLGGTAPGNFAPATITGFEVPAGSGNEGLIVNLPAAPANGTAAALGLAVGKLGSHLLQLELSALQADGRGEVISAPRVITANQKEALIEQGVEIPFQQATSSGATSVSFKKAVMSLSVTPQITPDDRIILDLRVTKDSVGDNVPTGTGGFVPSIDTREVQTQVLVDNGETVVLGGIYERTRKNEYQRVPFFGDLPVVGALFRNRKQTDEKDELLIFVTPKIIKESLEVATR